MGEAEVYFHIGSRPDNLATAKGHRQTGYEGGYSRSTRSIER